MPCGRGYGVSVGGSLFGAATCSKGVRRVCAMIAAVSPLHCRVIHCRRLPMLVYECLVTQLMVLLLGTEFQVLFSEYLLWGVVYSLVDTMRSIGVSGISQPWVYRSGLGYLEWTLCIRIWALFKQRFSAVWHTGTVTFTCCSKLGSGLVFMGTGDV